MAKFCGKCGSKLDEQTGKCPRCDAATEQNTVIPREAPVPDGFVPIVDRTPKNQTESKDTKAPDSQENKSKKKKAKKQEKKKKHVFLRVVAILLCLAILLSSVSVVLVYFDIVDIPFITNVVDKFAKKTPQEVYATEIVSAFNNNDISKINDIIFNDHSLSVDDNVGVVFEDSETAKGNKGALSVIFAETRITLNRIESNNLVYMVDAPDMNGVFDDISSIQTQEDLITHIEKYAKGAKRKKVETFVEFTEKDESFIANYKTEEFINAITGGLVDEYKEIFTQYMDEVLSKG